MSDQPTVKDVGPTRSRARDQHVAKPAGDADSRENVEKKNSQRFSTAMTALVTDIQSLQAALDVGVQSIQGKLNETKIELAAFMKLNANATKLEDGRYTVTIDPSRVSRFKQLSKELTVRQKAAGIISTSHFTSLISRWDVYFVRLLKSTFALKPEIIDSSGRSLTLSDLKAIGSLEEARNHIIGIEIDSLMRESHATQFGYLQKKNIMKIPEGDNTWGKFIEMTERRNLFVHTDGVVSHQYIENCKTHGINLNNGDKIGSRLQISDAYFNECAASLLELGLKVGHSIWRKLMAGRLAEQSKHYSDTCYSLIQEGAFQVAANLGEFSLAKPMEFESEPSRRMMTVNLAQAYKWLGNIDKSFSTLVDRI